MDILLTGFLIVVGMTITNVIIGWKKSSTTGYLKTNIGVLIISCFAIFGSWLTYHAGTEASKEKTIEKLENKKLNDSLTITQQELRALALTQLDSAKRIISLSNSLIDAQQKINELQHESISSMTGGDNYPILTIDYIFPTAGASFEVQNNGKYTIYDLSYNVRDVDSFNTAYNPPGSTYQWVQNISIGNLVPNQKYRRMLRNVNFNQTEGNIKVEFLSRNGFFVQLIKFRIKNRKILYATKIVNVLKGNKIMYKNIPKGFLNNGEKDVKWVDVNFYPRLFPIENFMLR